MIKITVFLKKLKNILPLRIRYSLLLLYVALIISALLEMIGLGTIPVFVSILFDPLGNKEFFGINMSNLFNYLEPNEDITKLFAFFMLAIYSFKTIFVFCTTLFELKISKSIKLHFSEKLLKSYIFKPYIFSKPYGRAFSDMDHGTVIQGRKAIQFSGHQHSGGLWPHPGDLYDCISAIYSTSHVFKPSSRIFFHGSIFRNSHRAGGQHPGPTVCRAKNFL